MTSYIYNMVDTWALSGGPYTSIKMNATDNDAASASLLMDLQVGTVSKFSVSKAGAVYGTLIGSSTATFGVSSSTGIGFYATNRISILADSQVAMYFGNGQNTIPNGRVFGFEAGASATSDTILTRRAAANLRFGAADAAAPVAQKLSVQSVVAGTTDTAGTDLTITGSQGTGTGAGGSIIFQVAPLGSSGSAQNALATALTIASTGAATFASSVTTSGYVNAPGLSLGSSGAGGIFVQNSNRFLLNSTGYFAFSSNANVNADVDGDVRLYRDAANTLALRNGTAAQEMRVYETTTGTIYKAILGNRQLIKIAGAAFDNGAGASAGTLTNAPAVGNPTKWIPIDDNGTTRHIPAW